MQKIKDIYFLLLFLVSKLILTHGIMKTSFSKMLRKYAGFLFLSAIFVTGVWGCAGMQTRNDGEFRRYTGAGMELSLQFPEAITELSEKRAADLEFKISKSRADHWMLARYHHIASTAPDHLKRSLAEYEALLGPGERDPRALNNIACLYVEMERYKDAERLFQNILGADDAIANAYFNLYMLYKNSARQDDAVRVLVMLKERNPCSLYAAIELGDIFYEKEIFTEAEHYYRSVMATCEANPFPIFKCAKALEAQHRTLEAEELYRQCIEKFPYFHDAYLGYAHMLLVLDRKNEAGIVLNRAAALLDKK